MICITKPTNKPEEFEVFLNVFSANNQLVSSYHGHEHTARAEVVRKAGREYLTIAYPVKIPLGYGVEK